MDDRHTNPHQSLNPQTRQFYLTCLRALDRAQVPYLVGGGYAMTCYTGIHRDTKDLDLFVRPEHRDRTLTTLTAQGYQTEFFYPFWIAKAIDGDAFIDILYSSGNGVCVVDDEWFDHAIEADVLGHPTRICPPEEQLWSKAFVQDRDRYDGADVAHLILRRGDRFDWPRLIRRFQSHERILLAHLLLFEYIYPSERQLIPGWVVDRLTDALAKEKAITGRICRGTYIAQKSYQVDVQEWGYIDGRIRPYGPLTREEAAELPDP